MSDEQPMRRATRPKGIVVLVLLFYAGAALAVLAGIVGGDGLIDSSIIPMITLYFIVLAWGLWKPYRWAWFSTIIMFILSIMYTLSTGIRSGQPLFGISVGIPIATSIAVLVYLLRPAVRRVYMHNGWEPLADSAASEHQEG